MVRRRATPSNTSRFSCACTPRRTRRIARCAGGGRRTRRRGRGRMRDATSRSATPPGYDLMIDFLSDGPTLRGLLAVLSIGADRLAAERGAAHGEALESAVLAALECLVTALDADVEAVARLREDAAGSAVDSSHAFRRTLDAVLLQDVAQCAAVLGYVQYRFNPALPLASLRVLSVLSDRVDRLVDLLPLASRRSLVEGAASCLELAALPGGASPAGSGAAAAETEGKVAEAGALVLDVLLDTLARPAPSVAHLLLGFDATRDLESSRLDPFSEFNCASVLLELLEAAPPSFAAVGGESGGARGGAGGGGEAPETAARLVFELVADPRTAPATTALVARGPPARLRGNSDSRCSPRTRWPTPPPRDPTRRLPPPRITARGFYARRTGTAWTPPRRRRDPSRRRLWTIYRPSSPPPSARRYSGTAPKGRRSGRSARRPRWNTLDSPRSNSSRRFPDAPTAARGGGAGRRRRRRARLRRFAPNSASIACWRTEDPRRRAGASRSRPAATPSSPSARSALDSSRNRSARWAAEARWTAFAPTPRLATRTRRRCRPPCARARVQRVRGGTRGARAPRERVVRFRRGRGVAVSSRRRRRRFRVPRG